VIRYEVDLDVDAAIAAEYRAWLAGHVAEILTLPGFAGAEVLERDDPAPDPARLALRVSYRLRDRAALDRYLAVDAARLRADGERRFGGRFRATRAIWRSLRPTSS
jgi:hypothetical protein